MRTHREIGIANKLKGAVGEREFVNLMARSGYRFRRHLAQYQGTQPGDLERLDADGVAVEFPYALEIKRSKSKYVNCKLRQWWKQTVAQALQYDKIPVLAYRFDYADWKIMLPMSTLSDSFSGDHAITVDLEGWLHVLSKAIAHEIERTPSGGGAQV